MHTTHDFVTEKISEIKELNFVTQTAPASEKPMTLADLPLPYVVKNRPITAPGIWNGYYLSADTIKEAFESTDWDNKEIRALYADHKDTDTMTWVGEVRNAYFDDKTGCIMGDLYFVDPAMAFKIAYGAKFGISPSFDAIQDNHVIKSFKFRNFAVVVQPAMLNNYINNSKLKQEVDKMEGDAITILANKVDNLVKTVSELEKKFSNQFDVSETELTEFAADPSFAEFVGKMKKKYPKMSLKEIAKIWKQKYKYPQTENNEQEDAKKKDEKYKKYKEYPYPKEIKNENEEDKPEDKPEEKPEQEPEKKEEEQDKPEPEEKKEENDDKESSQDNDNENEKKDEKKDVSSELESKLKQYEDMVQKLQEKISELSSKEVPERESEISSNTTQETKEIIDVFQEFIDTLKSQ